MVALFEVHAIGEAGRRRFVDDTEDVESGDGPRVLRRLALRVGEVGWAGDDGVGDRGAEVFFRVLFEFLQDHRRYLLRRVGFAVDGHRLIGAHRTLYRHYRAVGVYDRLTLRKLPDKYFAVFRKGHDRGGGALSFGIRYYRYVVSLFNGYAAVSCSKVYSNNFSHNQFHLLC
ncbi:hypothetical protein SDC9_95892 [bioreactor metagenome]|uniref:Uncharacterized protein n=1 Tax=bioreactor metagenome TaxID=1076179 RepID=A0A645AHN6_9ZZZZ